MNLFRDFKPVLNVGEQEYKRLLGYPYNHQLEGKTKELAGWAENWYEQNGTPWVYSILFDKLRIENEAVKIENVELSSKTLYYQFEKTGAAKAVLVLVSAGKECEQQALRLWEENKPDEYFFLEIYGSAVVENLVAASGYFLCCWAENNNSRVLPHYSPGYTGWKIEDQNKLWKLTEKYRDQLPGVMDLLDSGMLNPKKSMLALFGITGQIEKAAGLPEYNPCKSCSFTPCRYRRSPYKFWRKQIEDVNSLKREGNKENKEPDKRDNGLNRNVKYSINTKALRKWSDNRLKLKVNEDGSAECIFLYEGTTCSNLGHKLEFEYKVKLSSHLEGYRIESLNCIPSDEGYRFMCGYLKDNGLLTEIANERPLLGKPLDDVLKWKREFSPQGCYCNPESRNHKWGILFEVLHFALVEYEKNMGTDRTSNINNPGEIIID